MGGFNKQVLQEQSDSLLRRFSLPTHTLVQDAWTKFVLDDANVHIKADLTFKQSRIAVTPPLWGKELV